MMLLSIIRKNMLRSSMLVFLLIFVLYNLLNLEQNMMRKYYFYDEEEKQAPSDNSDDDNKAFFIPASTLLNLTNANNASYDSRNNSSSNPTFMLIDIDCMQTIMGSSNKLLELIGCRLPISIAVFQQHTTNNDSGGVVSQRGEEDFIATDEYRHLSSWLNFEFAVTNASGTDYWLFTGMPTNSRTEGNAQQNETMKRHAVKRFETIRTVLSVDDGLMNGYSPIIILMPSELGNFIRNWQNTSSFLDCEHALTRPAEGKRLIPLSFAKRIAEFMEFVEKYNATPFLMGGTLLGWRRECSIIPHTTDVDIGILREQHSLELLRALIASKTFSVSQLNGYMNSTFMMALWVDGIKIDFDYVFTNVDGKAYVAGFRGNRQVLRWIYPRIQQICTGDLLGHLIHVPCNVDEILKADYGPEWRLDHPSSTFVWDRSHKNRESGEILPQEEWNRIIVGTAGQNKTNATVVNAWLKRVGAI